MIVKHYSILICIIFPLLLAVKLNLEVSPQAILAGKYKEVLADKVDYNKNIEKYRKALMLKNNTIKQLDSMFTIETLSLWSVEEQEKLKLILALAKNNQSADVYEQLQQYGSEYAFTLNKVVDLSTVYALERKIILANKQIQVAEEWAAIVAQIANYFPEDFSKGNLTESLSTYRAILEVEKNLQQIFIIYKGDLASFLEKDQQARSLYSDWHRWREYIKKSPQREAFYRQLEEKIYSTF
jgi:hypothetical protein